MLTCTLFNSYKAMEKYSALIGIFVQLTFYALLFAFLIMGLKNMRQQSRITDSRNGRHKRFKPEDGKVTFADVAGLDEVKEDMQRFVGCLSNAGTLVALGGKVPSGILLVGPPGTGKTLLAKAVAGEAGVPFFYISASEFVEMFVGVGAARVRELFKAVRESAPCILFIDEIDAVAQHRGAGIGFSNDEREQTINQLLTELDGFDGREGVIVMAATNRPDKLDPAILRPGRFGDFSVTVNLPDKQGRLEILRLYAGKLKLADDVDLEVVARHTAGSSGADLEAIMKVHAPMSAVRRDEKAEAITQADLDRAVWALQLGGSNESKSRRQSEAVKRLIAYHELGHACVSEALFRQNAGWNKLWGDPVSKVTIIGAGGAGGYTATIPEDDRSFYTKEQLLGQVTLALAGNRAEHVFLSTTSTGADNDFKRAYQIVKKMVTRWGMSGLGPISIGADEQDPFLGRAMATEQGYGLGVESSNQIDREIKKILDECRERAESILNTPEMRSFINEVMVPFLLERETILRDEWVQKWDEHFSAPSA
ncbi:MAG: ATP-dependent zinc metalloprotease FtsH [Candidatus Melainabacteria bacterium]|nr:ATP-dependent zinc metalloprotease FtsH [Candidatus Melainabacteria bacterium]